jgi:molybdenum cofactor sulfurtransferase
MKVEREPDEVGAEVGCAEAEEAFLASYPEFASTRDLDNLRREEYPCLDRQDHVYLDYTGGGLYARSQIEQHHGLLRNHVFGNPHSHNPTSMAMTELVERGRSKVLEFFNASDQEYVVVFTANASTALKLVGEAYPFGAGDHYLMTFDNHNSVNGIREFARKRGATITYVPLALPEMRVLDSSVEEYLSEARSGGHDLFAYPAQSNFSGVQHPLEWISRAQEKGWDVLLDAAAFVPTNRLDLTRWKPDFVSISFYKMFGYPTGVGCLLARRRALSKLHRPWFSGGTITVASVQGDRYYMAEGSAAFEDGTVNYLNIPGVEIGLRHLESIGIEKIHARCRCLTGWLLENLLALRHPNGRPLIRLYGPDGTRWRGATLTMNFYRPDGQVIDHTRIEEEASRHAISLRTGCFCNPGGGEIALQLSKTELIGCFNQPRIVETSRFTPDDFRLCVDGKSTGAVRVSLGLVTNFRDVYRFLEFARRFVSGAETV